MRLSRSIKGEGWGSGRKDEGKGYDLEFKWVGIGESNGCLYLGKEG